MRSTLGDEAAHGGADDDDDDHAAAEDHDHDHDGDASGSAGGGDGGDSDAESGHSAEQRRGRLVAAASTLDSSFGMSFGAGARAWDSRMLSAQAVNAKQRGMGIPLGCPHLTREKREHRERVRTTEPEGGAGVDLRNFPGLTQG